MEVIVQKYRTIFFLLIIIVNVIYITLDNKKIETITSIVTLAIATILYIIKMKYDSKVGKTK
ncbi:hypothetical protein [Bacillus sp. AFS053548]|uniref:hypothetical protein n=1 Tax=Bacillus sp. AFS053548 TaxID=2033505 RepID=UPI000BFCCC18|nr:hypothetical protein [Bacillus sp. AFS053548]PGM50978.1 hypothetical protein CN946_20530 [Bacillus sp. AFS053548]